jgi:DNA-binding beta-propeller fold protein YncE
MAYDAATSRLYVSQGFPTYRISVFDVTAITDGENAINVLGQPNFTSSGAATTASGLGGPYDIAVAGDRLYVADAFNYRVVAYDVAAITNGEAAVDAVGQSDGTSVTDPVPVFTTARAQDLPNSWGFSTPKYSALDSVNHRLFVTDANNNRVLVFNLTSNNQPVDGVADYVLGQPNFYSTTPVLSASGMGDPSGIAYDATTNRLFVAERNNNRVLVYDVASITNGEAAVNVLGQPNLTSNNQGTTQNSLYNVIDIALDSAGQRLFVVDTGNNRVMVFDVAEIANGENAVNVIGKPNFTTATNDTTQSGLSGPFGIEFDSVNNRLFVGDYFNARVMVFDVASITNGENAVNVLGQPDYITTDYVPIAADKIQYPQGMSYDTERNYLYVADEDLFRIAVFDVGSITNGENAINVLGKETFDNGSNLGISQNYVGRVVSVEYDAASKTLYAVGENRIITFELSSPSFTKSATTIEPSEGQTTPPTFTVNLLSAPTTDVVLNISVDNTTSISVSPATLTFTSGNWSTPQTVTVTALEDENLVVDTGTITISVNDALSDDSYDPLADQTVAVTAYDNDRPVQSGGGGSSGPTPVTPTTPLTPPLVETPPTPTPTENEGTPETPQVDLEDQPAVCTVPKYPTSFIRFGGKNNTEQVKLLEQFLNLFMGTDLPVDGIYEAQDRQAVIAFQERYQEEILAPWKLKQGTGYVYIKTLAKIKTLVESQCK